jgi:diguanylate cyclase (GGDEF)-like protein
MVYPVLMATNKGTTIGRHERQSDLMAEPLDPRRALELAAEIAAGMAADHPLDETLAAIALLRETTRESGDASFDALLASLEALATRIVVTTGLLDRRAFDEAVRRAVARSYRAGQPVSALAVEIDHAERLDADRAAAQLAEVFRNNLRQVDAAARVGDASFRVLLPMADIAGAREVAERCRCAIAAAYDADVGTLTATFGAATMPEHAANGAGLLQAAAAALATGVRRGRNSVTTALPLAKG